MKSIIVNLSAVALRHGSAKQIIDEVKRAADEHPGEIGIVLRSESHRLEMGPMWRCDGSAAVRAKLELYGEIVTSG